MTERHTPAALEFLFYFKFNNDNNFIDENISSNTSRQIENKELQKKLNECLALLSEDHRTVVTLFDIQELSHAEIAKVMNSLRDGFQEGHLEAPAVTPWPFENAIQAYELVENGTPIKYILIPRTT